MSVKVCDRSLSKLEVVYHATEIREEIHGLCIRDFGMRDYKALVRKKMAMLADPEKNVSSYVLLMHQCKQRLHYLAEDLMSSTRLANRIKLNSDRNCLRRLELQERAIGDCELMIMKLQDVSNIFLVDLNRFRPCVESIDYELKLLKGWIRYTNKMRKQYQ